MRAICPVSSTSKFQIRFRSLFLQDRTVAFPCDERGYVDMDRLSEASRHDYLFARIVTRLECLEPEVVLSPER